MRRWGTIVSFLLGLASQVLALTYSTPEGQVARTMCVAIEAHLKKYGRMPHEWAELDEFLRQPLDVLFEWAPPTRRYRFTAPVPMAPPRTGHLVAIMRKPSYERTLSMGPFGHTWRGLKGPGRYLIYRAAENEVYSAWLEEALVAQLFAEHGTGLPAPDNEPEPVWIQNTRDRIRVRRYWTVAGAALVVALGWWVLRGAGRHLRRSYG